jgi:hypothetical protein
MILALSAPAVVWLTLRIESPAQELSR